MPSRIPSKAPDRAKKWEVGGQGAKKLLFNDYELRYFDAKHQYFALGGKWKDWTWIPSASAIAKLADPPGEGLTRWAVKKTLDAVTEHIVQVKGRVTREHVAQAVEEANRASDRAKDAAGDYGTRAHALFERAVATKTWRGRVADDLRAALEAMRRWRDEWQVEVVDQEFLVLHPELGYAGTGDLLCTVVEPGSAAGRVRAYFDLKTGKGLYRSNFAQIAGYEMADRATGGLGWSIGGLLHLPQGAGEIAVSTRRDGSRADQMAFEYARFLYWWGKERDDEFSTRRKAA